MSTQLNNLITILTLSICSSLFAPIVVAETEAEYSPSAVESIPDLFDRAFFTNTGNGFENSSLASQFNFLFGWDTSPRGSFIENSIERDAANVHAIYKDLLQQQAQQGEPVKTRDLANPFDTSLSELSY